MPKLKLSEATKKRYWKRKKENKSLGNLGRAQAKISSILRIWKGGTAISDGKGWYQIQTSRIVKKVESKFSKYTGWEIYRTSTMKNRDKRARQKLRAQFN